VSEFSHDTADEGFHEIQLSGKQLVFLFIVTTTVIASREAEVCRRQETGGAAEVYAASVRLRAGPEKSGRRFGETGSDSRRRSCTVLREIRYVGRASYRHARS
jgi:hypothetical protein